MGVDLTPGAISTLLSGRYTSMFKPVVQVIEMKCSNVRTEVTRNRVEHHASYDEIVLSDGSFYKKVMINYKIEEMITSNKLHKGSIVQLTRFSSNTDSLGSYISIEDLNVISSNSIILGDPKRFPGNKAPSVNKFIPQNVKEEPVDPDVNGFIPPKVEEEPVDPDVNYDIHHADEPTAPKQRCSSCSQTQSRKRQRQSSDNKEDGEIGACFEKLEKLGWEEGPMYDTAVLLFGESSDYRKIWLHLKPNSCANWVKNAGGKYGVLG